MEPPAAGQAKKGKEKRNYHRLSTLPEDADLDALRDDSSFAYFKQRRKHLPKPKRCIWQLIKYLREDFKEVFEDKDNPCYVFEHMVIRLYTSNHIHKHFNYTLDTGNGCRHVTDYENALNWYIYENSRPDLIPNEVRFILSKFANF